MTLHLLTILLSLLAASPTDGATPDQTAAQQSDQQFRTADDLLDALERADADIATFQSDIVYDRRMTLQGDIQVRWGKLYFSAPRNDANNLRTFGIHFHALAFDDAIHEEQQTWVFDGEWLVEKRPRVKQYIARQIAPPGEGVDPLRLGEGPLPIPIGQKKADILDRYEVQLVPVDDGFDPDDETTRGYLDFVREQNARQLILTPRERRDEAEQFRRIRLWYARNNEGYLLPVLSRTLDRKGDEVFVQLYSIQVNAVLPEGVMEIEPPPNATEEGWQVQIERRLASETPTPAGAQEVTQ